MRLRIGYPSVKEELKVLNRPYALHPADILAPVLSTQDVLELQRRIEQVHMDESVSEYLLALVHATRQSELLSLGVSTRGALALSNAAKAHNLEGAVVRSEGTSHETITPLFQFGINARN